MDAIKLDAVVYPSWNNPPHWWTKLAE